MAKLEFTASPIPSLSPTAAAALAQPLGSAPYNPLDVLGAPDAPLHTGPQASAAKPVAQLQREIIDALDALPVERPSKKQILAVLETISAYCRATGTRIHMPPQAYYSERMREVYTRYRLRAPADMPGRVSIRDMVQTALITPYTMEEQMDAVLIAMQTYCTANNLVCPELATPMEKKIKERMRGYTLRNSKKNTLEARRERWALEAWKQYIDACKRAKEEHVRLKAAAQELMRESQRRREWPLGQLPEGVGMAPVQAGDTAEDAE